MSVAFEEDKRKVTTHRLKEMKDRGEKISMLTAYDYSMASIIDGAGMDVILVGDSASNVMAGNITTLPMTLDQSIYHGSSVMKAVKRALVVVDMPFGTCSGNPVKSLEAAIRIMKETGADTLKIEGGEEIIDDIKKIIGAGIPVMGHLGLMPQSINKYGTYTVRAKGKLTLHGVTQERIIKGKMMIAGKFIKISAEFTVPLADHDISIPKIVNQKIAEVILINVDAELDLSE